VSKSGLWLYLCLALHLAFPAFSHAQPYTSSVAEVGANGSSTNLCQHEQSLNGPTLATCSGTVKNDTSAGAATAGAEATYGGLGIAGEVTVSNDKGNISMAAHAVATISDHFKFSNLPQESFLQVTSGLAATSSGSSSSTVFLQVEIQGGSQGVACYIENFGHHACTAILRLTQYTSGASLNILLAGTANVDCGSGCGAGAAGFSAGYSKTLPPPNTVLAVMVTDAKGNPLKNVIVTSLSGHKYPSTFASTVTLSSVPNPSKEGETVTFKSVVASFGRQSKPTGKVMFEDETTKMLLGSVLLNNGEAILTTSQLSLGSHVIKASYDGDDLSSGSSSPNITQAVN